MMRRMKLFWLSCLSAAATLTPQLAFGQGVYNFGAGPVNRSMGGASTAAPIDSIGATYWNPATMSNLPFNELSFGMDILDIDHSVSSSVGPFSGTTEGDPGTLPIPHIGWVYHTAVPSVTLGLGIHSVAGFKTNLPSSLSNPALAPQPIGLGRVSSEAGFIQAAPSVSVAVTDRLSIAAGPTITTGQVEAEPFVFDSPNGAAGYPSGRSTRYSWGGGFQLGSYYLLNDAWALGGSFKSKTWMNDFEYYTQDAIGGPRTSTYNFDLPTILSGGVAYSGWERWLIAADVRYFDYADADGFGDSTGLDPRGAVGGLGWDSVFATALGVQRQLGNMLTVRGGYAYNENPIDDSVAFYNIASPLFQQHSLSSGLSLMPNECLSFNVAGSYFFENTSRGRLQSPLIGEVPGSDFASTIDAFIVSFGISMRN